MYKYIIITITPRTDDRLPLFLAIITSRHTVAICIRYIMYSPNCAFSQPSQNAKKERERATAKSRGW